MPSKLYGILASGSAVIALADPSSELAELIDDQELGFVCDLRDPHAAASVSPMSSTSWPRTHPKFANWEPMPGGLLNRV